MCGVPVVGAPNQLDAVIEEFAVHGIRTDRVIIGGDEFLLRPQRLTNFAVPARSAILLLISCRISSGFRLCRVARQAVLRSLPNVAAPSAYEMSGYFRYKRVIDFMLALSAIVLLSPVFPIVAALVVFDVGAPVMFWQKRMGRNAKSFLLYKFRTLHAPFDRNGQRNANGEYGSWIGKLLRALRLDELPQLFNVLVGEMSLIGPRPLLPQDQPINCNLRLMIRPGITGSAQTNGGNLVTTQEKGALDDWYVQHASFWLDLRIALYTLIFLLTGERRSERAVREASALQHANGSSKYP